MKLRSSLALAIAAGICTAGVFAAGGARAGVRASGCHVAQTPTYTHYWGSVILAGWPADAGVLVKAINTSGEVVGCFEVHDAGNYGIMRVYGADESSQPPLPGMYEGEVVTFRVAGEPASAGSSPVLWTGDRDVHEVNLTAGVAFSVFMPWVRD